MKNRPKRFVRIVSLIILLPVVAAFLICGLLFVLDYLYGSKNYLGNNIYMVEEGAFREIVYCTKHKGNNCYIGIPIIPQITSREISVVDAMSTDDWVMVKAYLNNTSNTIDCYFLIDKSFDIKSEDYREKNCDSIIQSYITRFDNEQEFEKKLNELGIQKRFK